MSKRGRPRSNFSHFQSIATRWADNDIYGHVNNTAYYSFFDTAVNSFLIERCGLDIHGGNTIGLVVETQCTYHAAVAFPDSLEVGIAVDRIGRTSVVYAPSIFKAGADLSVADGRFVHVYVDRETRRPIELTPAFKAGLSTLTSIPSEP